MWIVGDIHGCAVELDSLLQILPTNEPIIFVGDYVDRGPDSAGVINRLLIERNRSIFLLGNHESMLLAYFNEPGSDEGKSWLHRANGGLSTLRSYNLEPDAAYTDLPQSHRSFFENLVLYCQTDDFLVVHAGLNIDAGAVENQDREDLLWIREQWIRRESEWTGKTVYYGHTPARYVLGLELQDSVIRGRRSVGLDTGCVYGGSLSAVNPLTGELRQTKARKSYWL